MFFKFADGKLKSTTRNLVLFLSIKYEIKVYLNYTVVFQTCLALWYLTLFGGWKMMNKGRNHLSGTICKA